jgi:hypothetical protein
MCYCVVGDWWVSYCLLICFVIVYLDIDCIGVVLFVLGWVVIVLVWVLVGLGLVCW